MSTSAIGTVMDALCDGLRARPGLSSVNVYSADVSLEEAGLECIAFLGATLDESAAAMGGSRAETWSIAGAVQIILKSWEGDAESTIRAARDRTLELFAEIETYCNDSYTGSLPDVEVKAGELTQGYGPEGRVCALSFTATVTNLKEP
jgi:hypothetical protein